MSSLSPRLQVRVQQKQTLTPGLVQMVSLLQLNRLELKDMITQEISENPVLEESLDGVEELTPEEVQAILESERTSEPSDQTILETVNGAAAAEPDRTADTAAERFTLALSAIRELDANAAAQLAFEAMMIKMRSV